MPNSACRLFDTAVLMSSSHRPLILHSPEQRMKFCHFQVNGWNWRTSFKAMLARLRKSKIACSTSYADYRPKTNAVISLDMGHTLRGECTREE
jgi:hypothetical protein